MKPMNPKFKKLTDEEKEALKKAIEIKKKALTDKELILK